MPIIRPINKKLLPHSIEYKAFVSNDGWNDAYADPVTIEYVRLGKASSLNRSSNSEGVKASHELIIDRVNSSVYPDVNAKDLFVVNGQEKEVTNVIEATAFGPQSHHLEIELA